MALETAREEQVTCNAICPGYVLTDLVKNQLEDTSRARGIPVVRSVPVCAFQQRLLGLCVLETFCSSISKIALLKAWYACDSTGLCVCCGFSQM